MKKPKYRANKFYCCETCGRRYKLKMLVPDSGCCKDSLHWDSEKEYNRWRELKLMEKAGGIKDLKRQVRFEFQLIYSEPISIENIELIEEWTEYVVEKMFYVADFRYYDCNKIGYITEDTKGYRTKEYKKKKKLMKKIYGIEIKET